MSGWEDLFDMSEEEILAQLEQDPEVIAQELELAEEAADYWRSISPEESGTYKDSIEVVQSGTDVAVVAQDPKANLIEFGSIHNPEYACRARTEEYFNSR